MPQNNVTPRSESVLGRLITLTSLFFATLALIATGVAAYHSMTDFVVLCLLVAGMFLIVAFYDQGR